jgi:hypothetical protein
MDQVDGRVVAVCCCVSRNRVYQNREAQMQYLLLSAAVCRGIECIKTGDAVLPTVSYMQYFLLFHMKTVMAIVPPM